ncbi:hypothetical protein [Robertkochia sediminum]|uniref:hypothetical protein n=1 Tax=Robertkochia sediminum TaxID=2785326 RepID=UPI001932DDB4|nr:hypothetical protein [Robertkochia sediminum]MBL7471285.1 hypothetical protein [Robertkochia sediminum]
MRHIFITLITLCFSITGFAQIVDNTLPSDINELFLQKEASLNYISNQTNNTRDLPEIDNNGVFIQQVGDYNTTKLFVKARNQDVSVTQNGDHNTAGLFLIADQVKYNLTQTGNHNFYAAFAPGLSEVVDHNVTQTGNNCDLVVHGKNSIMDKLKITMEGEAQSLIIRNFQ